MTSYYSDVYSCFLRKITDYHLASLEEDDAKNLMDGWFHSTLFEPFVKRLFSSISFNDEEGIVTYVLTEPEDDISDKYYFLEVVSRGMVVKWLEGRLNSITNINQYFGNSDKKFYSQASHLSEVKGLYEVAQGNLRKIIRDRGTFNNDYINGTLQ